MGGGGAASQARTLRLPAGNATSLLSEPVLEHLLSRWETLDPLVRARLLLSPLFLRKKDLADLQAELRQMAEVGCGDRRARRRAAGGALLGGRASVPVRCGGRCRPGLPPCCMGSWRLSLY